MIENEFDLLSEEEQDRTAYKMLKSISFYESIFEDDLKIRKEKLDEVCENICFYLNLPANIENRLNVKELLLTIPKEKLLDWYIDIDAKIERKKYLKNLEMSILYGDSKNKKKRIPNWCSQAEDLIEGGQVKGQDLYSAIKTLHWCNYSREEVCEIINCLKSQKAKNGNRYKEAKWIIEKYWNSWDSKKYKEAA